MSVQDLQLFDGYFPKKPFIRYTAGFAEVLDNSVNASLVLCSLLYWRNQGTYGEWTYKSMKEMEFETGLSRKQQDKAISILKKYGVVSVEKHGVPQKRHFRVDIDTLHEHIVNMTKRDKIESPKEPDNLADYIQTITETTNKNTRKSTFWWEDDETGSDKQI